MRRLAGPRQIRATAEPLGLVQRREAIRLCQVALDEPSCSPLVFEAPPGGGKTAILDATCALAGSRRMAVLRAAASHFDGDLEHGVTRQLLDPAGDDLPSDPDALWRGLAKLASTRPVLLAVDDLALADKPSLRFLRYVVQHRGGYPVVTVATLSPGLPGRVPIDVLAIQRAGRTVALEPLDEAGVAALRERAGRDASPRAASEIAWLTGGNPFLVTSLINHHAPGVPPEVIRDLDLRLARLPAEARLLAQAAAVLDEGASVATAARVMEVTPAAVLDSIDELVAADVLQRGGLLRFSVPLLRDAVDAMLARGERSRLHRLAARALWESGATAADAADHLTRADATGEGWAIELLARAASEADGSSEAVAYLRRALQEGPTPTERAPLLAQLATAELFGGGAEAAKHLAEAVELLPPGSDRAEVCDQLGRLLWGLGRYGEAARAFVEGMEGVQEGRVVARLTAGRLAAGRLLGDVERSLDGIDSSEPAVQAELALELLLAGGPRDCVVDLAGRALGEGSLVRRQTGGGPACQAAICSLLWADELAEAEAAATEATDDAGRRELEPARGVALLLRACARWRRGDLAAARDDATEAAAIAPRVLPVPVPPPGALLAEIAVELGDLDAAREESCRAFDATAPPLQHALALTARGRVRMACGDAEGALADLVECGALLARLEVRNPALAPWRSQAALAALRMGDESRAASLAAEERELAEAFGSPRAVGTVLAAIAEQSEGARRIAGLRAAADVLERSPARLDRTRVLVALGCELRRVGQRRGAREILRRALDLAVQCGATELERRARQDLVASGARPRRERLSGLGSLTPRERQVAQLAAEGRSNRAIANDLIVSQKTIEWHLANAYRKLEIPGRGGLPRKLIDT